MDLTHHSHSPKIPKRPIFQWKHWHCRITPIFICTECFSILGDHVFTETFNAPKERSKTKYLSISLIKLILNTYFPHSSNVSRCQVLTMAMVESTYQNNPEFPTIDHNNNNNSTFLESVPKNRGSLGIFYYLTLSYLTPSSIIMAGVHTTWSFVT